MSLPSLWKGTERLVLASKSEARRSILAAAGVSFDTVFVSIDERSIERGLTNDQLQISSLASTLASEKALAASAEYPGRLILGADQVLSIGDIVLHKPEDRRQAGKQLAVLAGQTHKLTVGYSFVRNGVVMKAGVDVARLRMRALTSSFIDRYLDAVGPSVFRSVGSYQIEAIGVHLFDLIEGDYSTIQGLPILPVLGFLRQAGLIET